MVYWESTMTWNPHIVTGLNNPKHIIKQSPVIFDDDKEKLIQKMELIVSSEKKARELLLAIPGVKKIGNSLNGIPLCYVLQPVTEELKSDDITIPKIGGLPDLLKEVIYYQSHAKNKGKSASIKSILERIWPRCGCCYEKMRFIGQYDVTGWITALHFLTADISPKKEKWMNYPDRWHSNLGSSRTTGARNFSMYETFWQFFFCPYSSGHFFDPNMDAKVFIRSHFFDKKPVTKDGVLSWEIQPSKKLDEEHDVKGIIAKIKQFAKEPKDDSAATPFSLRAIKELQLRWELDSPIHDCQFEEKIEKVMKENPDVFADYAPDFSLFGKPHSQQTELRPYCQRGVETAQRMAPLIHWNDESHDVTYQMYGDLQFAYDNESIFAKIDSSCT